MAEPSRRLYQTFGPIYQDRQKERSQLSDCQRGIHAAAQPGSGGRQMNLGKPVNPIRNYAFGSVITALILLSPVLAFLVIMTAEMLIDLLMVGGTSAVCAVGAGGIGLVLSRKFWRRPEVLRQSERKLVPGETSIAAAPM
jgi:hypothetical protein